MGSLGLPDRNSPDLHLVVATQEELVIQQQANSEEWRGVLSVEAYLRREQHLFNQDLIKGSGLTPWMLVYQPDEHGPRQVLCGCETINKRAMVSTSGNIADVVCHGVGSVFCPPEYRGHGYAGRMMTELGKKLQHWQASKTTPVLFSVLFSDIGKDFYAAKGWQVFPSAHVGLSASLGQAPSHVRLLKKEDLPQLCELDERLLRGRISKLNQAGRSAVALVPDLPTLAWHHARENFISNELYGKSPKIKGALVGETPGHRVFAYFTRVWTNPQEEAPPTLHILRLVVEDESSSDFAPATPERVATIRDSEVVRAIAAILAAAQAEAAQWDMKEVSIWNPTSATLAAAQSLDPNAVVVHRERESITSLRWYDDKSSWQSVDWVCNEKYGWC